MTDLQKTSPEVAAQKAATMIESLPWLKKFRDRIVVVKYGGNAMISEELQDAFAEDIAYLRSVGVKPVVVHGGGPQISSMLDRLAIPSEFKGGYRVTSTECGTRPSMIAAVSTPPWTASRHACILGIMPDSSRGSIARSSVAVRRETSDSRFGQSAYSPGTSVRTTSFAAPRAIASADAAASAFTFKE